MILLSKLADYGVIVAAELAQRETAEPPASALHLAADTRLPPTTVAKVLKLLSKARLVTASRGAAGGYRLARPAHEIRLSEVVAAIDGDFALTQCAGAEGTRGDPCLRHTFCSTRPHWTLINQAVAEALDRVTLAEMRRPQRRDFGLPPYPNTQTLQEVAR